jgi:2',3'-cyclic-nucleotide 2'-phosphodiesterase (5'-nucleotidase family)
MGKSRGFSGSKNPLRGVRRSVGGLALGFTLLLDVGCGTVGWLGGQSRATGGLESSAIKRDIPVTPGVPKLGQQPRLPRDPGMDGDVSFHLLYTNDIHSRVDPFPAGYYHNFYAGKGGFARLTTAIADFKRANPNTLAVDSGDYLQGTPYFNFFRGEAELKLMQASGFDAITIGNHEFDNGVADLARVLPYYRGSLVTTNMTFEPEVAARYCVKRVGNVRVGIFALITDVNGLVAAPNFKGARYYDPVLVAKAAVAKLRKEADAVVLLSHMGITPPWAEAEPDDDHEVADGQLTDEKLAARVPGIDVIVSGHTHVMIKRPIVVKNTTGRTYIVSSGMGGGYLGQATVRMRKGQVSFVQNDMIPMTASVSAAPAIESMIAPYRDVLSRTIKPVIGEATATFKRYGNADRESALNNLIADATLAAARSVKPETAFAVMSSGTPRNPIPQGPIRIEDVYYALPFDNKVVLMEVTGKQAVEMLGIQRRSSDQKRHAISNCSYTLLRNAGPIKDVLINGQPVNPDARYWVAVNDYMADGASGFTMLPGSPRIDTKILQRDALIELIKSRKTITPQVGRIRIESQAPVLATAS